MVCEHRLKRRVQFYETDAAGIVHFSWFFRYMEEAEHAMWRAAGLSIHGRDQDVGFPRVSTSFDFHRPLRFEEEFEVWLRITAMTKRTMKYACVLTREDVTVATGSLTVACVRVLSDDRLAAVEIPEEIAARFQVAPDITA